MKHRILSMITALALCLSLLPGTARAAEGDAGPVTITDNDGQSVTLAAGKYYVINDGDSGGGVTEQDEQPESGPYLTYADGVLTVFGNSDYVRIYGKMALSGDLKVARDPAAQNNAFLTLTRTGDSGPALSLNGHTLTLEKVVYFEVLSDDQPAVDGGTIRFTKLFGNSIISIHSENANAASGDLAVENAGLVNINGKPPVFQSLDVKECNQVQISPDSNNATELSSVIDKITIDRPISLSVLGKYVEGAESIKIEGVMTTDGKIWAEGWEFDSGTHFIDSSVTTPTAYWVGDGWAFYTPGAEGTPAKLTLDGASYEGTLNIHQADSVQLELKGENAVKSVNATAMTLTGNGSFTGIIGATAFTNNSTGTLNAVVECPARTYTVYGDRSTSDFSARGVTCSERTPLTITNGATLTVPERGSVTIIDLESLTNHGTIVNGGGIQILLEEKPQGTPNFGTIVNNGGVTIYPTVDITGEEMSAFIKGMGLSGTGTVTVEKTDAEGNKVTENYTNSGLKLFPPAGQDGTLDLSSATDSDTDHWDDQGYKWEVTKGEDDNGDPVITSATLTLAPGFNAETLTLPDTAVTIVTQGESTIETLSPSSDPQKTELTFSGPGPLTIAEQVNIAGGDYNSLTVDAGANVIANGGIYIGASGGVNSIITVNGTLTATAGSGATVIHAGSVAIGDTGVLNVSGADGVLLSGMPKNGDEKYNNLFSVTGDGRFSANCSNYNIKVDAVSADEFPKDSEGNTDPRVVINLPADYWPENCEPKANGNVIDLWNTAKNEVYSGKMTIHKNHIWSNDWTDGGDTHYHVCTFEGCTAKTGEAPHYYAHGSTACRDCNHLRPDGAPDSDGGPDPGPGGDNDGPGGDSDGSGGSSGGSSSGSGSSGSGPITYSVNIEKTEHGKVSASHSSASGGTRVTLTVTPDEGYDTSALTVTDRSGKTIVLTESGGGKYTFVMPSRAVTVKATFAPLPDDRLKPCDGGAECPSRNFTDLGTVGTWYHEAVDYVLRNHLMGGYGNGTFGPNNNLTRAQFAQILFNKEGRPVVDYLLRYSDVADGAWYTEAIRWATSRGIVSGYGNGTFGPNENITREQLAVMLWRYAGSPAAADKELRFTDADRAGGYALEALRWAVENGVMSGKGGGILDPQGLATRAQAAQVLKNLQKSKT